MLALMDVALLLEEHAADEQDRSTESTHPANDALNRSHSRFLASEAGLSALLSGFAFQSGASW